jgi:hypothetical protein
MRKAFLGIGALLLLVLAGAAAVVKADIAPPPTVLPVPERPSFSVQTLQGFAMDKTSLDTEPAVFVRLGYSGSESTYLFIGEELHRLHETSRQWVQNGEVVKYSVEGSDDALTLYSSDGFYSSAFGLLGEKMVVFQPAYEVYPLGNAAGKTDGTPVLPMLTETPAGN